MPKYRLPLLIAITAGLGLLACQSTFIDGFDDFEAEYAAFTTQALTQHYLARKVHHWLSTNNGTALVREIEFARYKHPHLLKQEVQGNNDLFDDITALPEVQNQRNLSPAFDQYIIELSQSVNLYTHTDSGLRFVNIPGGSFVMGSGTYNVTLSGFQMAETEVTQGQWEAVMGEDHWPRGSGINFPGAAMTTYGVGDDYPMYYVNWCDIVGASGDAANCSAVPVGESFLDKLNATGTGTYRLPTEAEWEYAARAGTTGTYACGEYSASTCPALMAWFGENATTGTKPVATRQANAWGLYDMHGNVYEWVNDWSGSYNTSQNNNPTGPSTGTQRVLRGGSWGAYSYHSTSRYRVSNAPSVNNRYLGFRVVRQP